MVQQGYTAYRWELLLNKFKQVGVKASPKKAKKAFIKKLQLSGCQKLELISTWAGMCTERVYLIAV